MARLRSTILERSSLSFYHKNDQDQVATHVDDRDCHHGWIFGIIRDEDKEGDDLNEEVQTPKELVGVPLF